MSIVIEYVFMEKRDDEKFSGPKARKKAKMVEVTINIFISLKVI